MWTFPLAREVFSTSVQFVRCERGLTPDGADCRRRRSMEKLARRDGIDRASSARFHPREKTAAFSAALFAKWLACWVQIAAATLSGNSLRQTVHTYRASAKQTV